MKNVKNFIWSTILFLGATIFSVSVSAEKPTLPDTNDSTMREYGTQTISFPIGSTTPEVKWVFDWSIREGRGLELHNVKLMHSPVTDPDDPSKEIFVETLILYDAAVNDL